MKVALLTCTGARPEAFRLCERWIGRQTWRGFEWLVVDDGPAETTLTLGQTQLRRSPHWQPGQNTQLENLVLGLSAAAAREPDILFFIEDDDWYAPDYVEQMLGIVREPFVAFGEAPSTYYHVGRRAWSAYSNYQHASLCQTAITREAFPIMIGACSVGPLYPDLELWNRVGSRGLLHQFSRLLCLGIKGMPGRAGAGGGHDASHANADPDGDKLRALIGADAEAYL